SEGDTLTAVATTFTATEAASFTGTVATFTDTYTANTGADFSATIDWGDGTTTAGTVTGGGGTLSVSGSHSYADEGTFAVTVVLTDDAPGTASATAHNSAVVVEGDTLTPVPATFTGTEAAAFSGAVATFTDTNTTNTAADFTA